MIITRNQINEMVMVIRALAFKDISFMQGHDPEAIFELDLCCMNNRKLRSRAQHILDMVKDMPFESIESRNLWKENGFRAIVHDFLCSIDVVIDKFHSDEKLLEEMHLSAPSPLYDPTILEDRIRSLKFDGRSTDKSIIRRVRSSIGSELDSLSDNDILDIVYDDGLDKIYPDDGQLSNIDYTNIVKNRRMK